MAEFINIKTDIEEVNRMLSSLGGNKEKMRRRILSAVGTAAKNAAKKAYRSILHKRSGSLYKSITSKVTRNSLAVIVSPTAENRNIRYGYALAKGVSIRPKKKEFLTFKIGDKWVRKHQVTIRPHDFIEAPVKQYLGSKGYRDKLDELMRKEIERAEKAAKRK